MCKLLIVLKSKKNVPECLTLNCIFWILEPFRQCGNFFFHCIIHFQNNHFHMHNRMHEKIED